MAISIVQKIVSFMRPQFFTRAGLLRTSAYSTSRSSDTPITTTKTVIPSQPMSIQTIAEKFKGFDGLNHSPVTEETLTSIVGDQAYHELPIMYILSSRNNTKMCLTDCNGRVLMITSCGVEGFKNANKQTTVACQATGISIGLKAKKTGVSTIRVVFKGIGRGRLPGLQGLNMAGLNIVSITDDTAFHYGLGRRPRKVRRM